MNNYKIYFLNGSNITISADRYIINDDVVYFYRNNNSIIDTFFTNGIAGIMVINNEYI